MWTKFTGFDIQRVSVQRVPECKIVDPKESEEENEEENQEREKEGKNRINSSREESNLGHYDPWSDALPLELPPNP